MFLNNVLVSIAPACLHFSSLISEIDPFHSSGQIKFSSDLMLISRSSLATTSKFQTDFCFEMRAVALININTKECKDGRHLSKFNIRPCEDNREIQHRVYVKRQTGNDRLLVFTKPLDLFYSELVSRALLISYLIPVACTELVGTLKSRTHKRRVFVYFVL